jgi:hypothetical protein
MSYELHEQMAFRDLLDEMEAAERAALDQHRSLVQRWFDCLPEANKRELAHLMRNEWCTCQALSAAAGDYRQSRMENGHAQRAEVAA